MKRKLFEVKFLEYTNCTKSTVGHHSSDEDFKDWEYLDISDKPIIMDEAGLQKYKVYGNGFEHIRFIGYFYD